MSSDTRNLLDWTLIPLYTLRVYICACMGLLNDYNQIDSVTTIDDQQGIYKNQQSYGDIVSNNIGSLKIFEIPIGTFGLRDNLACAIQNSFRSKRKSLGLPLE